MHWNIQATVANAQATRSVFVALGQGRSGDAFDNFGIFKIINFKIFSKLSLKIQIYFSWGAQGTRSVLSARGQGRAGDAFDNS